MWSVHVSQKKHTLTPIKKTRREKTEKKKVIVASQNRDIRARPLSLGDKPMSFYG